MNIPAQTGSPKKRGCLYWLGRGLLALAIVLIGLMILGAGYQALSARKDNKNLPPPGKLVDVGGYRLHINCMGAGSSTVILEGGSGEASPMWGWIQPQIAAVTSVCTYDRAGFAWSENGPQPRDGRQIVSELHQLLRNAGIQPPYLLVGHSFGGELMRLYTSEYPAEVAGLALIDSSHPDQYARMPELQQQSEMGQRLNEAGALTAPFGLMRLYWGDAGPDPNLPPQQGAEMRAIFALARTYRTQMDEDRVRPLTDEQVRIVEKLGTLPLIVVSRDDSGGWMTLQEELSRLSTNSQWRVVKGASHLGLLTDQQYANQTSIAILEFVETVQSESP